MATIESSIALYDNFSPVLNSIMDSMNLTIATVYDMQSSINGSIDTSSIEAAENAIHQAGAAMEAFNQQLENSEGSSEVDATMPTPESVQVPVHWQVDNMEIFTNTGVEWFEQEVQSANSMLSTLNQTQAQIQQAAAGMDILPDSAIQDINVMGSRLETIQQRIQQIAANPVNMGTDEANSELENLRSQLDQAIQEQNELNAALQNMDVSEANSVYLRLSQNIDNTERYIRDNVNEQGQFNNTIEQGTACASGLNNMITKAVGAFAGIFGIRKVISFVSDSMDAFDTQLNAETQLMSVLANMLDDEYVSDYLIETTVTADTSEAIDEINEIQNNVNDVEITVQARTDALQAEFDAITTKASEIQGRGIYGDEAMIAGAAELSTYFTDPEAITTMMDTLANYAMGMSGGGALDSTAMVDYATGLGKVMSGAYDAMTKKGFEFTDAQKAVIEGTATEAQIVEALGDEYLDMSSDMQAAAAITQVIDESWAGLYETMSDTPQGKIIQMTNTWGDMKEVLAGELYPYIVLFVDTITENWPTIQTMLDAFVTGLQSILAVLNWLLQGAMNFASFVIDNWSWIEPIVMGIVAALAVYYGWQLLCAVGSAIMAAGMALLSANPVLLITIAIIVLIGVIFAVCSAIAKMTGVADSGFGVMCGVISVVIAFFKNLALTGANVSFAITNAILTLCSNMSTAFHNAICNVQSWFYGLLSTALTVIAGICEALNKLPFIEFDYSGIISKAAEYTVKSAEAASEKGTYDSIADAFNEGMSVFDTFQDGWAADAFEAGASWGDGIADKISNFDLTSALGLDGIGDTGNYAVSASDYTNALSNSGVGSDLSDVAANTGATADTTADIADALDITSEELKYLRDIAERDIIDRTVYRDIIVDVGGMQNTVKNEADLEGIASKLASKLTEQIKISAEGA